MKCADLENTLALLAGDAAAADESGVLASHLAGCPLCRQKQEDYADVRRELRRLAVPQLGVEKQAKLKTALRTEIRRGEQSRVSVSRDFAEWLQMRLMPYSVGVAVSLVLGIGMLTLMMSGQLRRADSDAVARSQPSSVLLASNRLPSSGDGFTLTAADVASSRTQFAYESPSVNPQGALVALTKSLVRGEMKDEEVVVVADVFSNGLASISEVVESPKDRRVVEQLEKALANDAKYAPFVPTVLEDRPENMKIILRLNYVNVNTGNKPPRRRA